MTEAVLDKAPQAQEQESVAQQSSPDQSSKSKTLEELAIVVIAKGLNPISFTPDFLVHSGIIPADWLLLRKPVVNQNIAQIAFQNGISLTAQAGKVTFSESIEAKTDEELMVAELATKYVNALPHAEYAALGINPQKVETFNERSQDVNTFMTKMLLQPGDWQEVGTAPMQASLNLLYQFENCRLQLNLNPTELSLPSDVRIPGILFTGNFHYELSADDAGMRKQELCEALSHWKENLSTYRSLIEEKFLSLAG